MAEVKGAAVRATLDFIEHQGGAAAAAAVLGRLAPRERRQLAAAAPTDVIPFRLVTALWEAADRELGGEHPDWVERAGAHSIESFGLQLYGGILRKSTPMEFLNQPVKLFRLYYHTGDMRVVEEGDGRAVLRLVDFDEPHALFCRRQTGGLRRALELAGAESAAVRHVRCGLEGDAYCEWELVWRMPGAAPPPG